MARLRSCGGGSMLARWRIGDRWTVYGYIERMDMRAHTKINISASVSDMSHHHGMMQMGQGG